MGVRKCWVTGEDPDNRVLPSFKSEFSNNQKNEIGEVVLAIKLGIKAVIIRLAARKKIFYVLLELKQIFIYFRKVYGYKVLKFITRVYKLLFKEEEEE